MNCYITDFKDYMQFPRPQHGFMLEVNLYSRCWFIYILNYDVFSHNFHCTYWQHMWVFCLIVRCLFASFLRLFWAFLMSFSSLLCVTACNFMLWFTLTALNSRTSSACTGVNSHHYWQVCKSFYMVMTLYCQSLLLLLFQKNK